MCAKIEKFRYAASLNILLEERLQTKKRKHAEKNQRAFFPKKIPKPIFSQSERLKKFRLAVSSQQDKRHSLNMM